MICFFLDSFFCLSICSIIYVLTEVRLLPFIVHDLFSVFFFFFFRFCFPFSSYFCSMYYEWCLQEFIFFALIHGIGIEMECEKRVTSSKWHSAAEISSLFPYFWRCESDLQTHSRTFDRFFFYSSLGKDKFHEKTVCFLWKNGGWESNKKNKPTSHTRKCDAWGA